MTVIFNNLSYEEVRWNIMGRDGASGKAGRDYISYLGDPDVDFTKLAAAYNIDGAVVKNTDELRPAIERGIKVTRDGRPFMLDVRLLNTGAGAEADLVSEVLARQVTGTPRMIARRFIAAACALCLDGDGGGDNRAGGSAAGASGGGARRVCRVSSTRRRAGAGCQAVHRLPRSRRSSAASGRGAEMGGAGPRHGCPRRADRAR